MIKECTLRKINLSDIEFYYPETWKYVQEEDNTWIFQDEYSGSFRISVMTEEPGFNIEKFLQDSFHAYEELDPVWKIFNGHTYLCFEQLPAHLDGITGMHFYLSGSGNKLVSCSYAYEQEVIDRAGTEHPHESFEDVDHLLNSLSYPG